MGVGLPVDQQVDRAPNGVGDWRGLLMRRDLKAGCPVHASFRSLEPTGYPATPNAKSLLETRGGSHVTWLDFQR